MGTESETLTRLLEQHRLANESLSKLVQDSFGVTNQRLNSITQEVLNVRKDMSAVKTDIKNVKADISKLSDQEIEITNGNNIPIQVRRDDVLVRSYNLVKPGGHLDKKIDELNQTWADNLKECRTTCDTNFKECQEKHTPTGMLEAFNKKASTWEKAGKTILWFALLGMIVFSFFFNKQDRAKQADETRALVKEEVQKVLEK